MGEAAALGVVSALLALAVLGWLWWSIRKEGWTGTVRRVAALPSNAFSFLRYGFRRTADTVRDRYSSIAGGAFGDDSASTDGGGAGGDGGRSAPRDVNAGGGRKGKGKGGEAFAWVGDAHHYFRLLVPTDWHLVRSSEDNATSHSHRDSSAILLQATSDAVDASYMRLSVAFDDISWSRTTAEDFCRGIQANLHSLVPGSAFVSSGPFKRSSSSNSNSSQGEDAPYQLTYRLTDPLDHSTLELINVVFSSNYGRRRRAYTVTFGCDAKDSKANAKLAAKLLGSFELGTFSIGNSGLSHGPDNVGYSLRGGSGSGIITINARPTRGLSSISDSLDEDEEEDRKMVSGHVPVWERERERLAAEAAAAKAANNASKSSDAVTISIDNNDDDNDASNSALADTPSDISRIRWANGAVADAGLKYRFPANWQSTGIGSDDAEAAGLGGFASSIAPSPALSSTLVRRFCVTHTCDRREGSFKQVSLVAVDISPLVELVTARVQSYPSALIDSGYKSPGALLLAFLGWRYRCEVMEAAATSSNPGDLSAASSAASAGGSNSSIDSSNSSNAVFLPSEAGLKSWVELFAQRWPATARVSIPLTSAMASSCAAIVPRQTAIADTRAVGNSLLYKTSGWLRTAGNSAIGVGSGGGGGGGGGGPGHHHHLGGAPSSLSSNSSMLSDSSPKRHGSSYSTLSSLDLDSTPAEGLLLTTTSAVLIGLHEASIATKAPLTASSRKARAAAAAAASSAAASATAVKKRTFGHFITCALSSDVFAAYEPLAKAVFQSLEATDDIAAATSAAAR